jgi:hypothetical protein
MAVLLIAKTGSVAVLFAAIVFMLSFAIFIFGRRVSPSPSNDHPDNPFFDNYLPVQSWEGLAWSTKEYWAAHPGEYWVAKEQMVKQYGDGVEPELPMPHGAWTSADLADWEDATPIRNLPRSIRALPRPARLFPGRTPVDADNIQEGDYDDIWRSDDHEVDSRR